MCPPVPTHGVKAGNQRSKAIGYTFSLFVLNIIGRTCNVVGRIGVLAVRDRSIFVYALFLTYHLLGTIDTVCTYFGGLKGELR